MDATHHRRPRLTLVVTFVVATALFAAIFFAFPVLYDTDSYYHLGIARLYFEEGQLQDLPWARFSLMADGFGDKELLFHWLLAPFAGILGAAGGRLALALLVAGLVTALAALSLEALGHWGALVPVLVCFGSQDVFTRLIRLRPELASLLLLLAALECAATRRYRLLGIVALTYTLTYTAFHAFLLLCLAWFAQQGLSRRRWDWPLLLYPILGAGVGLLAHPNFPHNLVIWKVQSVDFFLLRHQLDVGAEIGATQTDALLRSNLGWIAGIAFLWLLSRRSQPAASCQRVRALRDFTIVAAVAFGLLYLLGRRFALYSIPLATLAIVFSIAPRFPLPRQKPALRFAGLALVLLLVLLPAANVLWGLATARTPVSREQDWSDTGVSIPARARVAATWGLGQLFVYFAPHASYLNVLDPVFMAVPHPAAFTAQRELFDSRRPDVPLLLWQELDSDHLLVSRFHQPQSLLARLEHDPRLLLVRDGLTRLYRILPQRNHSFLRDWRVEPPVGSIGTSVPYPALQGLDGAIEGFIDLSRLSADSLDVSGCATLTSDAPPEAPWRYELAPWGPTTLWHDGHQIAGAQLPLLAILGRGIELELRGGGQILVKSCLDGATGRGGFFLRRLPPLPRPSPG